MRVCPFIAGCCPTCQHWGLGKNQRGSAGLWNLRGLPCQKPYWCKYEHSGLHIINMHTQPTHTFGKCSLVYGETSVLKAACWLFDRSWRSLILPDRNCCVWAFSKRWRSSLIHQMVQCAPINACVSETISQPISTMRCCQYERITSK